MSLVLLSLLYIARKLLEILGSEDYGIYNVVSGVVLMLGFFNGAMISTSQRFFSFALGKNDTEQLNNIYSTILRIQIFVALGILLLAETLGLWMVKSYLVIPPHRMQAAFWVYQCATLSFTLLVVQTPFSALIISHEKMNAYSYIGIGEILLRLISVLLLPLIGGDSLIIYALFLLLLSLLVIASYIFYCRRTFREVHYTSCSEKYQYKELLSYMGWNLWGNAAAVIMNQGVNILVNLFFGPTVNAARAIALQVQSAVNQLGSNLQVAINPQIVKSYAGSDLDYMHSLIFRGAKFSFFLILILALPIITEAENLLGIWLVQVPAHTLLFTQLGLVVSCFDSLTGVLMAAAHASGKIKRYQATEGILLTLNLPLSYVVIHWGYPPEITMAVAIVVSVASFINRLCIIAPLAHFKKRHFLRRVVVPAIGVAALSSTLAVGIKYLLPSQGWLGMLATMTLVGLSIVGAIALIGLTSEERLFIREQIQKRLP